MDLLKDDYDREVNLHGSVRKVGPEDMEDSDKLGSGNCETVRIKRKHLQLISRWLKIGKQE